MKLIKRFSLGNSLKGKQKDTTPVNKMKLLDARIAASIEQWNAELTVETWDQWSKAINAKRGDAKPPGEEALSSEELRPASECISDVGLGA